MAFDSETAEGDTALPHGGRLREAARHYEIPLTDWMDLSTGINPHGWRVPPLPQTLWARLPEADDGLAEAAGHYYETEQLLPVAGSQVAIQTLPRLWHPRRVGVITPGYAEHRAAWMAAGHEVTALAVDQIDARLPDIDILVIINPNNPTGHHWQPGQLRRWQAKLAGRGGWLVVDEAFADATPALSLAPEAGAPGLIVLRSLGKFFGLAGARVGFVCGPPDILTRVAALTGPWPVSNPARWVARQALRDTIWQAQTRRHLNRDGERLRRLLQARGWNPAGGCALFQWLPTPRAAEFHEQLARQGILTRLFDDPPALRLGLPGSEQQWWRLEQTLAGLQTFPGPVSRERA